MYIAVVCALLVVALSGILLFVTPLGRLLPATPVAVGHVIFLAFCLVAVLVADPPPSAVRPWLVVGVVAAAVFGGGVVVRSGFVLAARDSLTATQPVLPGSAWIGAAERFGIVISLAMGIPEMAAVIVAIKALGQYAEAAGAASRTNNTTAASRVLGTLLSVAWTLFCVAVLYLAFGRLGFDHEQ
jgi:hypothetical protein